MTKVGIIRCEKNETRCPLTNCFKTMIETTQGFGAYDACIPAGVFTCRCPGDNVADMAKILKSKGAEAIHLCTCTFASKTQDGWIRPKADSVRTLKRSRPISPRPRACPAPWEQPTYPKVIPRSPLIKKKHFIKNVRNISPGHFYHIPPVKIFSRFEFEQIS